MRTIILLPQRDSLRLVLVVSSVKEAGEISALRLDDLAGEESAATLDSKDVANSILLRGLRARPNPRPLNTKLRKSEICSYTA